MYDFREKVAKVVANNKSKDTEKNQFFRKETKKLMAEGYTRANARAVISNFFNRISATAINKGAKGKIAEWAGISPRRTRRERNRDLKVPYSPIYNGPVYKSAWTKDQNGEDVMEWTLLLN